MKMQLSFLRPLNISRASSVEKSALNSEVQADCKCLNFFFVFFVREAIVHFSATAILQSCILYEKLYLVLFQSKPARLSQTRAGRRHIRLDRTLWGETAVQKQLINNFEEHMKAFCAR